MRFPIAVLPVLALAIPSLAPTELAAQADPGVTTRFDFTLVGMGALQENPWFGNSEANIGVEPDAWTEWAIKPELGFNWRAGQGSFFGELSMVGTKTYGDGADGTGVGFETQSDVTFESAHLGWRRVDEDGDQIEVAVGNFDYRIGTGFLIADGGSDGGNRGGFYVGARTAFRESARFGIREGPVLAQAFYLGNNPNRLGTPGHLAGANLEVQAGERVLLGGTFLSVTDVEEGAPANLIDLRTFGVRADLDATEEVTLSGEYAGQSGGDWEGSGWWAKAAWAAPTRRYSPALSYRYATLSGDDPGTEALEGFRPLAYGFSEYAEWYQGEITGSWLLGHTNLSTHRILGSLRPHPRLSLAALWLNFALDEPGALGVESSDFGNEVNVFLNLGLTERLALTVSLASLFPGDAALEYAGGDGTWSQVLFITRYAH